MIIKDVPLFPLELVLFPQMVLPLRIFETRYRQMITECIKDDKPFGVVLLQSGDSVLEGRVQAEAPRPFKVGTLARITEVTHLEDGGMMITTIGTGRFHLREYRTERPYMTGDVELWPDEPEDLEPGVLQETVSRVTLVFEQYLRILMELAGKRIQSLDIPTDPEVLSFLVPNWLYISAQDKQLLLEAPGLRIRLENELHILENETTFFEKIKTRATQPDNENNPGDKGEVLWKETNPYDLRNRFSAN
jgi:Lon protease-like protein